ncbi:MAG: pyrroloquinoline quinone-dependent dehydrogenase [Candidatus Hydrogenedentota bacterium]
MRTLSLLSVLILSVGILARAEQNPKPGEWTYHGGDFKNTKYSPLDQIDKDNFGDVKTAWIWESIDKKVMADNRIVTSQFKPTPIYANGLLYLPTSICQVVALKPDTGELVWEFDPEAWRAGRPANVGFQHRGLSYWTDGKGDNRIIIALHDRRMLALNADTGKPILTFGDNGFVDTATTLGRPINPRGTTHSSPVGICNDTIILGSIVFDGPTTPKMPPGHVRGYDVRTGEMKWIFHTIPQPGEFGNNTWEEKSWEYSGNTNVWSMFAMDEELDYVYLPVSTPTNDMYGGHRLGDNLFAESVVCLNASTGERVWHFQAVHHGVWDYDFPTAPNLMDITVDGKKIKAIAQVSKQAYLYVFDRVTGEPVWPIEEKEVPQSSVPGERTAPTQPHPTWPKGYDHQGFTEDDVIDFTPELREQGLKMIEGYSKGPIFTPPDEKKGTIGHPGAGGGSNWQGAAYDPETQMLYIPSNGGLGYWRAVAPDPSRSSLRYISSFMAGGGPGSVQGLPLSKPPYSRITAINMNTGEHTWMTPHGDGPTNHKAIKHLNLGPLGIPGSSGSGPLVTKTLLLVTQGGRGGSTSTDRDKVDKFNVYDKATGEWLGLIPLPATPYGNPLTYEHEGKQYLTVACGGGGFFGGPERYPAQIVTLALP